MKIENAKKGMRVQVKSDISKSLKLYGSFPEKENTANKYGEIRDFYLNRYLNRIEVRIDDGDIWTYDPEDLRIADKKEEKIKCSNIETCKNYEPVEKVEDSEEKFFPIKGKLYICWNNTDATDAKIGVYTGFTYLHSFVNVNTELPCKPVRLFQFTSALDEPNHISALFIARYWRTINKEEILDLIDHKEKPSEEEQAILDSIAHWKRMIDWVKSTKVGTDCVNRHTMQGLLGEQWIASDCDLCKYSARQDLDYCSVCPLVKAGYSKCSSGNGPVRSFWERVNDAPTWEEWLGAAKGMLQALKITHKSYKRGYK